MNRYLVTGSTGFIGKRLIEKLQSNDCQISVISRKPVENVQTYLCDFEFDQIPEDAFDSIDTVIHLAGYSQDIKYDKNIEKSCKKINVDITLDLARLAIKKKVKKFIFISSVKAGKPKIFYNNSLKIDEDFSLSFYGKTKREAEIKLIACSKNSDIHISIVRPALVYGPSLKGNLGAMMSAVEKGWFPPIPETNNRRSLIHVDDLVSAIFLVAENERNNGEIYIATDGKPYSTREIYNEMRAIKNKPHLKWSIPKIFFRILAFLSPSMKFKLNKLMGNEYYSSNKLNSIGFRPKYTLKDLDKRSF
jgi:UDP-glucose 4-epimerase